MFWLKSHVSQINKIRFTQTEQHYSQFTSDELYVLLCALTYKVTLDQDLRSSDLTEIGGVKTKFVGVVNPNFFCLSRKEVHPQSFLPRVSCNITEEDNLTKLDLSYQLFPSTKFWFILFTLVCLSISFFSYLKNREMIYLPIIVSVASYLVAKANFIIHCKTFKKALLEEI